MTGIGLLVFEPRNINKQIEIPFSSNGFLSKSLNRLPCLIGRLGYTGERGFEIILPIENHSQVWKHLSNKAQLCGFSAIDRLRIEAGFILFANEFQLPVSADDVSLQNFTRKTFSPPSYRLISFRAETDEKLDSTIAEVLQVGYRRILPDEAEEEFQIIAPAKVAIYVYTKSENN